jgi:hypothetical protein
MRDRPGAAGLRPPQWAEDLAGPRPAACRRPQPQDRLAPPGCRWSGRVGRGHRPGVRAVPWHRGAAGPLRPGRVRPPRHRSQHPAALFRHPGRGAGRPGAVPVPGHGPGGAHLGPGRPRDRPCLRTPRRPHPGPHVDRQRRPRPGPVAPGARGPAAELLWRLLRVLCGGDLRQPVPRQGARARAGRGHRPDRLVDRPGRSGPHPAAVQPPGQRPGCLRDAA